MQEETKKGFDWYILAWIIGIISSITMLACFILCGKGAKATNISYTYNNTTYTTPVKYNEDITYHTDVNANSPTMSTARVGGYNNNGIMTYNFIVQLERYDHTGNIMGMASGCTQNSSTTATRLGLTCTSAYAVDNLSNTTLTVNLTKSIFVYVSSNNPLSIASQLFGVSYGSISMRELPTYQDGISEVTSNPHDYNLRTEAEYTQHGLDMELAGIQDGEENVTSNPNAYNLYTQQQYNSASTANYNDGYSAGYTAGETAGENTGKLYVLNYISSLTNRGGTGTTYTTYSDSSADSEMNSASISGSNKILNNPNTYGLYTSTQYNNYGTSQYSSGYTAGETAGQNDVTTNPNNYDLYTETQYNNYGTQQYNAGVTYADGRINTSSASYTSGYTYGRSDGIAEGSVEILNKIADNPGGTGTTYTSYSNSAYNTEMSSIYNNAYNIGVNNSTNYLDGQIYVLNHVSSSAGGTGTIYTDYSSNSLDTETASIYRAGELLGIEETNSPKELTKFIPRLLAGIGGAMYPILTYEVFGISIMNFIILFLGLGLLYIVLKFVL